MILSRSAKAALLAALFVAAPAIAQGEPHDPLPGEEHVLRNMGKMTSGSYDVAIDNNMDVIGPFMHQQASDPAAGVKEQATGWIDWGMNAVVASADYAGEWIAARSEDLALASQNAYEWLSAHASFMSTAAYGATEWVTEKSQNLAASTQGTADWIASNSKAVAHATAGTVTSAIDGISVIGNWSTGFLEEVKERLKTDKTSEFAMLVSDSGFVLANVVVGVGLIPELDVEFKHDRDLTPEERDAFEKKVNAYADKVSGPIGYLEMVLLRNLAKAGTLSGELRISELHIDLFPLPGLELYFDPLAFEKTQDEMIVSADKLTKMEAVELKQLEARMNRLEAELAARNATKAE